MSRYIDREDSGTPVLFLDAFSVVPGVGPDSDMDGHDLSGLTYSEEMRLDDFIEHFNDNYAEKASEIRYMGMRMILVKDFWDDELMGMEPEDDDGVEAQDYEQMVQATKDSWDQLFNLTPEEKVEFEKQLRQKYHIK